MVKENKMVQTDIGLLPEDWMVIRLGDYVSLKNGYAFPSIDFSDKGPIVMTPGNFKLGGGLKFNAEKLIRYKGAYTRNMQFSNGDLVMVMTDLTPDCNLLGKAGIIDTNEVVLHNQRIGKIECSKNIQSHYLAYYFNSETFSARMKNTATGSTVRHTSTPTIKNTILPLPPLPEQEAIAEALSDADAWIASLEQLIDKKRLIKQGAMQELLSPKENWEVKKLGEIIETLADYTANGSFESLKNSVRYYSNRNYAVLVRTTDLDKKEFVPERFTDKIGYDFLGKTALYGGELILANVGSIGKVFRVPKYNMPMTLAPNTYMIKMFSNYSQDFVYQWMKTKEFVNKLLSKVGSSTLMAINKDNLREIIINIPKSLTEQTRIATILSDMDAELEALEAQLGKARKLKQGMMQELLTGRVRLI